jgi:hypothetical protein
MSENIEAIEARVGEAQEFNTALAEHLGKNFFIDGKTMVQWKKHFYVDIPEEVNFSSLVKLSAEVSRKYQEAAYHRDKQGTQLILLEQAKDDKYHDSYHSVRREHEEKFGKTLSAESCRVAATLASKDLDNVISNQKIIKDFWAKTCETLVETRKHLELIGWALSADLKLNKEIIVKTGG